MQLANIILPNASAVSKTFKPVLKSGLVCGFADTAHTKQADYEQITLGMRNPQTGVPRKVTLKVVQPYTSVSDSGSTTESVTAFIEVVIPTDADATAVSNLIAFASGALGNDIVKDVIVSGAFPY